MTLLKIFTLEDTKEEDVVSSLPEGEHIIGRGVTLNCNDKRISRKHALINVSKDAVSIKSVHINPCFFKAADGNTITILPKDTSVELRDGDQFSLLADLFWFKVRVIMDKDEDANHIGINDPENTSNNISVVNGRNTEVNNLDMPSNSNSLPSVGKRCQEDDLAEACKRQKISVGTENEPTASFDRNTSHENSSSRPLSRRNSLDLLLNTSPNLEQNIDSNQLINSVNNIFNEDYGTVEEKKQKPSESDQKEAGEGKSTDDLKIDTTDNGTRVKEEKANGNSEIKKEQLSDSESNGEAINKTAETSNTSILPVDKIKKENVEGTSQIKENEDTDNADKDSKNDQNEASCSKDNPNDKQNKKKSRRERCWYSHTCYRKNPQHLSDFSHPGDDDFLSDPDDDRSVCPFGDACYRTNLTHRRDYKHTSRPAPKPNDGRPKPKRKPKKKPNKQSQSDDDGDSGDDQNGDGTRKKRKAAMKKLYADNDSADDDYDFNDPFIDDASSDEFQLSSDDDDSTDWEDSQKVDEESQETRRLLKEAKRFTKAKQKKKD